MASWHERDCRRPDVVLMDNSPTCLSCGSLFFENDDEAQEQLSKQTAVVDRASLILNLDWPSSITFSSPDDVTNPELKRILLELDRYAEVADEDTASEMTPSEYETFMEEHTGKETGTEHRAAPGNSQVVSEPPAGEARGPECGTQTSAKEPNIDKVKLDTAKQTEFYHSLGDTDEIRLLHLDSYGSASQPLHGFLRPARLSQRPEYIALSYTWADQNGDRTLCDKVFLGNAWTPFPITSNCAAALRRIRLRGGERAVWIDAICIDQSNIGERSHQVSMMRDIYSRAESVAIYLGGDTAQDVDTPAGRLMQRLSDERFRAGKAVTDNWGGGFDYLGICDLFDKPYWSRIWVIQEVLLARKADIILGSASISLHEFIDNFMKQLPPSVESLLPTWIYFMGGSRFGDADAFSKLLEKTSLCKASDKRDMVFALFGLLQGARLEGLVADYSKTMAEVYTGLAAYFLIRHGKAGLLKTAASATMSARKAGLYKIHDSRNRRFRVSSWLFSELNIQSSQKHDQDDRIWHPELASWIPFANPWDQHDIELFHNAEPSITFDGWKIVFATVGRKIVPDECYYLTEVQPTCCDSPRTSPSTYQVFGNHGTLLVRALPVVHMSYMGSELLYGAFTSTTTNAFDNNICILRAAGTSLRWEICVHTSASLARDDDWIIEAPGCDALLHLKPSGRVPGTYKIVSLASVILARNYRTQPNQDSNGNNKNADLLELATDSGGLLDPDWTKRGLARSDSQYYEQVFEDALSHAGDPTVDYRIWMPLISCKLKHLLFLRQWESMTRGDKLVGPRPEGKHLLFVSQWESMAGRDRLVGPRQEGPDVSSAELSQKILEKYGQWSELKPTPDSEDRLQDSVFDSVVRTVSLYLERWDDQQVWSRIQDIVVEVPWQALLQELADVKADVWQYLAMRDRFKVVPGETSDTTRWAGRLQELFEDLISRLPEIPLHDTEGVQSLGSFMSRDACSTLCNSIRNIPQSWSVEKIRTKEAKIFKDWTRVESCWEFMERSKADCHALRGKFVQLRALKRLCRREYRDFLIC